MNTLNVHRSCSGGVPQSDEREGAAKVRERVRAEHGELVLREVLPRSARRRRQRRALLLVGRCPVPRRDLLQPFFFWFFMECLPSCPSSPEIRTACAKFTDFQKILH